MARYEVHFPASPDGLGMAVTLRVEADTWLGALKQGWQKMGGPPTPANVICDTREDGSIDASDPASGRSFRIIELAAAPATTPGVASLTADMLDEGAGSRTALELADAAQTTLGAPISRT